MTGARVNETTDVFPFVDAAPVRLFHTVTKVIGVRVETFNAFNTTISTTTTPARRYRRCVRRRYRNSALSGPQSCGRKGNR